MNNMNNTYEFNIVLPDDRYKLGDLIHDDLGHIFKVASIEKLSDSEYLYLFREIK